MLKTFTSRVLLFSILVAVATLAACNGAETPVTPKPDPVVDPTLDFGPDSIHGKFSILKSNSGLEFFLALGINIYLRPTRSEIEKNPDLRKVVEIYNIRTQEFSFSDSVSSQELKFNFDYDLEAGYSFLDLKIGNHLDYGKFLAISKSLYFNQPTNQKTEFYDFLTGEKFDAKIDPSIFRQGSILLSKQDIPGGQKLVVTCPDTKPIQIRSVNITWRNIKDSGCQTPKGTAPDLAAWELFGFPEATDMGNDSILFTGGPSSSSDNGEPKGAGVLNLKDVTFKRIGDTNIGRYQHTSTLLSDGTVLIVGGIKFFTCNPNCDTPGPSGAFYPTNQEAEIYDPKTQKFTLIKGPNTPLIGSKAILLPTGKTLLYCGSKTIQSYEFPTQPEVFDPVTRKFLRTGPFKNPHVRREGTCNAFALGTGQIFFTGGGQPYLGQPVNNPIELYTP
jgi:hypothetical protein